MGIGTQPWLCSEQHLCGLMTGRCSPLPIKEQVRVILLITNDLPRCNSSKLLLLLWRFLCRVQDSSELGNLHLEILILQVSLAYCSSFLITKKICSSNLYIYWKHMKNIADEIRPKYKWIQFLLRSIRTSCSSKMILEVPTWIDSSNKSDVICYCHELSWTRHYSSTERWISVILSMKLFKGYQSYTKSSTLSMYWHLNPHWRSKIYGQMNIWICTFK